MTQTVAMRAPIAGGTYIVSSGTTYTADVNQIISSVVPGDVGDLINSGCQVIYQRPVTTPVVSSYIVQGAINYISSSTAADAFTLAAPSLIGEKTTIVNQSTGVPTITSSGADILTSTGGVCTVLTGTSKGGIDLEAIASTKWQVSLRTTYLTSAGAIPAYAIASS